MLRNLGQYLLANLDLADWVIGDTPLDRSVQSIRISRANEKMRVAQTSDQRAEAMAELEAAKNPDTSFRVIILFSAVSFVVLSPFFVLGWILDRIGLSATWFLRLFANPLAVLILLGTWRLIREQRQRARAAGFSTLNAFRSVQTPPLYTPYSGVATITFSLLLAFMSWGSASKDLPAGTLLAGVFYGTLFVAVVLSIVLWLSIRFLERIWFQRLRTDVEGS